MKEKIKLAIGTIIFFSVITGYVIYNDYQVKHVPKEGIIIENNIEAPEFDEVFTRANTK